MKQSIQLNVWRERCTLVFSCDISGDLRFSQQGKRIERSALSITKITKSLIPSRSLCSRSRTLVKRRALSCLTDDAFLLFCFIRGRENGCILIMILQEVVNSISLCFCFCFKTNCDFVNWVFPVNQGILPANKSQYISNTLRRKVTMQTMGQLVGPARATMINDGRFKWTRLTPLPVAKGKNNEFLFPKMTSDVEQAWAHPFLFPDPVIYSANLTETKVLKAVMESYLNWYWTEPFNSSFVGTFFHSHFFRSIKATSFKMQIVNAQFSWPESQVSWRLWHAKWWNLLCTNILKPEAAES